MVEIIVQALSDALPAILGGIFGLILAHLRSKKALDACLTAKKACNEEVHCLKTEISDLKTAVLVAQARTVGLEVELEKRVGRLERLEGSDSH